MNKFESFVAVLVLSSGLTVTLNAQATKEEDVEIIEIVGQFSVAQWGKIADQAKMDFYELFNELNDIDKFRMVCKREKPMGSNIRRSVCEPMYFKQAIQDATTNTTRSSNRVNIDLSRPIIMPENIAALTRRDKEAADAHMEKLINEHPDLRKKFEYYAKAKRAFEIREQMDK
jgi:hypothetical protein